MDFYSQLLEACWKQVRTFCNTWTKKTTLFHSNSCINSRSYFLLLWPGDVGAITVRQYVNSKVTTVSRFFFVHRRNGWTEHRSIGLRLREFIAPWCAIGANNFRVGHPYTLFDRFTWPTWGSRAKPFQSPNAGYCFPARFGYCCCQL